jgi:signal transduction histidine kinase
MKSSRRDSRKPEDKPSEECMRKHQTAQMENKAPQATNEELHAALFEKFVDLLSSYHLSGAFLETIRNPLVILDHELRVIWANLSFYRTFRLLPEDTENKVIYEVGGGAWNIPALRALLDKGLLESGPIQNIKIIQDFQKLGKKELLVSMHPVVIDDSPPLFFISIDDISEFGQMAQQYTRFARELEVEQSRLKSIIENAPEAIVVVDEQCRIILANQIAHKLYARPVPYKQNLHSHAELQLCCTDGTPTPLHDLPVSRSALNGETCNNQEMMVIWPNGKRRDLLVNSAPIKTAEGTICGAVGVFQDITQMKDAQRERDRLFVKVQSYADQLKEANEELIAQTEALHEIRADLEKKVQERTGDLLGVNQVLQDEIFEHRETEKRLRKSEIQLRKLSARLLEAQENERKLIARELHDSIGASLAAIKFSLEEKLARARKCGFPMEISLEDTISIVRHAIEETRVISTSLRPPIIDDLGILATIRWFCREFHNIYASIRIEYRMEIGEDDVPEPLKIVIYRILQEALNNVAKHSHADRVMIFLQKIGGNIMLRIEDNGQGFHLKQKTDQGMGLSSMKDRATLSGGTIEIQSHADKGTTIRASWPVTGI